MRSCDTPGLHPDAFLRIKIVWSADDSNDDELYLYRINTNGPAVNITMNSTDDTDTDPDLSGNYLIWEGDDGNNRWITGNSAKNDWCNDS